ELARPGDRTLARVDAHGAPLRADESRQRPHVATGPAADVQDAAARREIEQLVGPPLAVGDGRECGERLLLRDERGGVADVVDRPKALPERLRARSAHAAARSVGGTSRLVSQLVATG